MKRLFIYHIEVNDGYVDIPDEAEILGYEVKEKKSISIVLGKTIQHRRHVMTLTIASPIPPPEDEMEE